MGGAIPRNSDQDVRRSRSRWFAIWYVSIALGFVLLAIRSYLVGGKLSLVILRLVVAAGFAVLGYVELRSGQARR